jgi:hypothetical protein
MLVSPFIVETGGWDTWHHVTLAPPGMVKRPRIRFPNLLGTVSTAAAAE